MWGLPKPRWSRCCNVCPTFGERNVCSKCLSKASFYTEEDILTLEQLERSSQVVKDIGYSLRRR